MDANLAMGLHALLGLQGGANISRFTAIDLRPGKSHQNISIAEGLRELSG
jgi:hypothetical protein